MVMSKSELVSHVATTADLTKPQAGKAVEAVLSGIQESLVKGEEVKLIGFGSFAVQKTKAREGRNPRTGETLKIAASNRATFRAGKELKEALNPVGRKK
jgi:DNA-binding protein HU-beta